VIFRFENQGVVVGNALKSNVVGIFNAIGPDPLLLFWANAD
jgi:DNA-directed RNA polymerase subunit E'/Rpb7